ncbi:WD40/YVTN/BNR-like repeat-containing protein [Glycomyces xiaoerkulensis]|uniref:WD40/YVTN/BNR-like repeat-containing protein n=1 Tax=Glycomyces xiaoerkulensis TaxID=2038139 RepID=UPI000C25F420|nr:sialidase family protein [Glycomyces xiaoerkulensis]
MAYLVLIGTRKGLFTATSDDRRTWRLDGPVILDEDGFTAVAEIYAIGTDPDTGRILVGAATWFGPSIWRSDDYAATWSEPIEAPMAFPQDLPYRPLDFSETAGIDQPESDQTNTVKRIWQLTFGPGDRVWAGVEPTSLWTSDDGGQTFTFNRALWEHPEHTTWASGAGGPAVHTIVPDPTDPKTQTVAISSGGIYQTRDDGHSWTGITKGITVDYAPDETPDSGQCIHKVTRGTDGTLYTQSHGPAYRSTRPDGGWTDISANLPSKFGFAIVAHPTEAGTVMAWPVTASMERTPPDRQVGAWRTEDSGDTWQPWHNGLPTDPYFGGILRDGACTDAAPGDPGWYFGTRCGDVWAAADSDGRWHQVAAHLPDVLCVRAMETA